MLLSLLAACGETPVQEPEITAPSEQTQEQQDVTPSAPSEEDEEDKEATETTAEIGSFQGSSAEQTPASQPQQPAEQTQPVAQTQPTAPTVSEQPQTAEKPQEKSDVSSGSFDYLKNTNRKRCDMFVFGDGWFSADTINDFAAFAREDGVDIFSHAYNYNTIGKNETYNLYETFNWSGTELTGVKGTNVYSMDAFFTNYKLDFALIQVSRDRSLMNDTNEAKNRASVKFIYDKLKASNPNATLFLVVCPGYQDGCSFWSEKLSMKPMTRTEHTAATLKIAEKMKAECGGDAVIVNLGDAFDKYYAKHGENGVSLYRSDLRHPSPAGGYLSGAVLYESIFGKSVSGMDFKYLFTDEEAKTLQTDAHDAVFGTGGATHKKDVSLDRYVIPTDMTYCKNQVFPKNYDILLSTALAYYDRGTSVQYDQLAMDRVNYSAYRRTEYTDLAPEDGTPQKTLFLDCTAFVWAVLKSAFDYELPQNRSKAMALEDCGDIVVYEWNYLKSGFGHESAIEKFLEALQPGDVVAYSNKDKSKMDIGHGLLYLGNGTIMHCTSGSRLDGGSADYQYASSVDSHEPLGSVRFDTIEYLIKRHSSAWEFADENDATVRILRPPYEKLTPTAIAKARAENLADTVVYKETSAPEGVTVTPGADITFSIVVNNMGKTDKKISVTDTLPAGLTLKSGKNVFTETVKAGETKTFTYVATLSASAKSGDVIDYHGTAACGVTLNNTPVYVGKTLTAEESSKVASAVKSASAKNGFELANTAWLAIGKTFPFSNGNNAYSAIFNNPTDKSIKLNDGSATVKMIPPYLVGGQKLNRKLEQGRSKEFLWSTFLPGDVILYTQDNTGEQMNVIICVGEKLFAAVENGKTVYYEGTSECMALLERLPGAWAFAAIRPSLG